jgi:hypothetical protein
MLTTIIGVIIFSLLVAGLGAIRMRLWTDMKWRTIIIIITVGTFLMVTITLILLF